MEKFSKINPEKKALKEKLGFLSKTPAGKYMEGETGFDEKKKKKEEYDKMEGITPEFKEKAKEKTPIESIEDLEQTKEGQIIGQKPLPTREVLGENILPKEKVAERLFNVTSEVPLEEDWNKIQERILKVDLPDFTKLQLLSREAMEQKILFNTTPEINWDELKSQLEELRDKEHWHEFLSLASKTKILFPEKVSHLKIDKEVWENGLKKLDEFRQWNWEAFTKTAAQMQILFSEGFGSLRLGDAKEFQEGVNKTAGHYIQERDWERLFSLTADAKIIVPQNVSFNPYKFLEGWEEMKQEYKENPLMLKPLAVSLKIAAASKIYTSNGLELVGPGQKPYDWEKEGGL